MKPVCNICHGKRVVIVTSKSTRKVPCWVCNKDGLLPGVNTNPASKGPKHEG